MVAGLGRLGLPAALLLALLASGCASPGPPRAPSLQLPATVSDLTATRRAGEVELSFAVSARSSDGEPYRGAAVRATVCRAVEAGSCVPVPALSGVVLPVAPNAAQAGASSGKGAPRAGSAQAAMLHDVLPGSLTIGAVRLLTYRVELTNAKGRTAGFGDAAYAAAGAAPGAVAGLRAEGSREGVVLRWQPAEPARNSSDVALRRELVAAASGATPGKEPRAAHGGPQRGSGEGSAKKKTEPGVVWLSTAPMADPLRESAGADAGKADARSDVAGWGRPAPDLGATLDDSAVVGGTYRYEAERQRTAQIGGHTLVLHSTLSGPVEVALRAVYPPPAPTDLAGTVFPLAAVDDPASAGSPGAGLAVDLIWTPADDPGVVGYNVTREVVHSGEAGISSRTRLTKAPVRVPAFHDVLPPDLVEAAGRVEFQYSVTAVDASGLESSAVVTVVGTGGR